MIYEFAVDPVVVATWYQRELGRFFAREFGVGTPRIISRLPAGWKTCVWEEFRRSGSCTDLNAGRMTAVLKDVSAKMIKRNPLNWDNSKSWLSNAESEHSITPFHAILSHDNPRSHQRVLRPDSIDHKTLIWHLPTQKRVLRNAHDLQEVAAPMLRLASEVLFVDPHFHTVPRYMQSFSRFFKAIVDPKTDRRHSGLDRAYLPNVQIHHLDKNRHLCQSELARILPHQLNLVIYTLKHTSKGQSLHNRYILTDIGGLAFAHGLDENTSRASADRDEALLLEEDVYRQLWSQYANGANAFEVVNKVRIKGIA